MKLNNSLIFITLIFLISFWLFFYKLGSVSLASWDEAWYAGIARNLLISKNPFLSFFNGAPYYDHPPLGFWLIAVSFRIFGVSEFSARLPMVMAGLGSLILVYLCEIRLFGNRWLAFLSSLVLATMPWFWLRSRTANLDALLVFVCLLSFFLALEFLEKRRFLPLLGITFGLVLLTKTIIGLFLLPVIGYIVFPLFGKIKKKEIFGTIFLFFLVVLPWYLINLYHYGQPFLERHFLQVGFRINSEPLDFDLPHTLEMVHMGILLWYKPFLLALLISILFLRNKAVRIIDLWVVLLLGLFSFSSRTELWHLIPLYPAISLLIPGIFFIVLRRFLPNRILILIILTFVVFVGQKIVVGLYKDIVRSSPPSQEAILARELSKYNEGVVYIEDDYWPVAVFYSNRREVVNLPFAPDPKLRSIALIFDNSPRPFLILTRDWLLKRNGILEDKYEVLFRSSDRVLIRSL